MAKTAMEHRAIDHEVRTRIHYAEKEAFSRGCRVTRGIYQMTLGKMYQFLVKCNPEAVIVAHGTLDQYLGNPHSYRGYYTDLAFELNHTTPVKAGKMAESIRKDIMNSIFIGWKGGDYQMDANTPVWVSPEGSASGIALMDMIKSDDLVIEFLMRNVDE